MSEKILPPPGRRAGAAATAAVITFPRQRQWRPLEATCPLEAT